MSKNVYIGKGNLAGKGLYAARDFNKDELVKAWNLKQLNQDQFDKLPKSEHMFVHTFNSKLFLFPEPPRYTNHSANPTVYSDFENQCDYALRPIKKDEPITINANEEIQHELETFIKAYKQEAINDFRWLKGGYRNAIVSYNLSSGSKEVVSLKRIDGNWHILNEQ